MITQLKGKLVEIHPAYAVVECAGVGYWVNISLISFEKIRQEENVKIFTHLIVREDAQILYGFYDKNERSVFEKLISVNGVGPASAMMMLSTLNTAEIYDAIAQEDAKQLQSVKGIGAKTAQRIIIDLKDKLPKLGDAETLTAGGGNKIKNEALSALEVLGISKKVAEKHVQQLIKTQANITLEEVIKRTLKKI